MFTAVFDWMETIHHLSEYLESNTHLTLSLKNFNAPVNITQMVNTGLHSAHEQPLTTNFKIPEEMTQHLDNKHDTNMKQTKLFVSVFALLRMIIVVSYIALEYM